MGSLDGVRVIDFGQYIAGPLTAQFLTDQGAYVIRVDPPGGPAWDSPANAFYQRGKRSITLDLKDAADCETARRLVLGADVLVENFRPGVMDRLGLGADAVAEANPALIYCSLPGFAEDDPRAGIPAWEGVVKAATGTYRRNREGDPPGAPVYTPLPIASTFAAEQAAIAITMALNVRERDSVGQRITVPLFDAMLGAIGYQGMRLHEPPPRTERTRSYLGGSFRSRDGRWVYFGTANGNTPEVLAAIGASSWHDEGLFTPDRADDLRQRARDLFATRDAEEWEAIISEAGGECAVCRESWEWLRHPEAAASGIVVGVSDHELGATRQPGLAVSLSAAPGEVHSRHPLDSDRDEILRDAVAWTQRPVRTSGAVSRPALDGVRVLDLCAVLAGPTAGRTLAEYGADVIKIEAPARPPAPMFHLDVNRGKRGIVLDLKRPEGQEMFWRLLEDADVVVENFRKGAADRLGIGYEAVRAQRPDIVYASLNMYGQQGELSRRPGHEQFAQAATGMQARYGGEGPPQLQRLAVTDYGTGYLRAFGIALALFHRKRTGEGQHVSSSLATTSTLMQGPFMLDFEGARWDEPRGQSAIGDGSFHRAYPASDGWFFLGMPEDHLDRLAGLKGMQGIEGLAGSALEAALVERFQAAPVDHWVEALTGIDIGAHRYVHDLQELMADPWVNAHGLSMTRDLSGVGTVTHTGPAPRLSRTPVRPGLPTPQLGEHNEAILAELGWTARTEELRPAMLMTGGDAEAT